MNAKRTVRTLRPDEEERHLETLNLCYDSWGNREKWLRRYREPGFNVSQNVVIVEEKGEWLGGGTAWFREAFLNKGKRVKVYIAGDAYVHPSHRGKGVYSDFIRARNDIAKKKGAALGFSFISMYEKPFVALRKHGFVDLLYPTTKILVLNPSKFYDYLMIRMKEIEIPKKFEGMTFELTLIFNCLGVRREVSKLFLINDGRICELGDSAGNRAVDLRVTTDAETLLELSRYFYLKKGSLFLRVLSAFFVRHLKLRLSLRLVRKLLGS